MRLHWLEMEGEAQYGAVAGLWASLLLEWRNDPETRKASHNTERVHCDDHYSWLASVLISPNCRLAVAKVGDVPVGTVRADLGGGGWKMSWTVAPCARRRGIGKRMVTLLTRELSEPVWAEVKIGNQASARIAEHVGMKLSGIADGVLHYRRTGSPVVIPREYASVESPTGFDGHSGQVSVLTQAHLPMLGFTLGLATAPSRLQPNYADENAP